MLQYKASDESEHHFVPLRHFQSFNTLIDAVPLYINTSWEEMIQRKLSRLLYAFLKQY